MRSRFLLFLLAAAPPQSGEAIEGAYGLRLGAPAVEARLAALGYAKDGPHWSRREGEEQIYVFTGPIAGSDGVRIVAIDSKRIFAARDPNAAFYDCQIKRDTVMAKLRKQDRRLKLVGEGSDNFGAFIASYSDFSARTDPVPPKGNGHDQRWMRVQCYRARDAENAELHISWELGEKEQGVRSETPEDEPSDPST